MSSPPKDAVEVVHAAVPGRVRVRIRRLRRNGALLQRAEQRFLLISGVRSAAGNVHTASVLLWFEPTLEIGALLRELERALSEVFGSWQPPAVLPAIVSTPPLGEAPLSAVLGVFARLLSTWMPPAAGRNAGPAGARARRELARRQSESGGAVGLVASRAAGEVKTPRWHVLSTLEVLVQVRSEPGGLSDAEAARRRAQYGPNALASPPQRSKLSIFLGQFRSVPVAMLAASALLSVATGGLPDAVAILAVVLVNASIGYLTESNAERIISSLGHVAPRDVDVLREGTRQRIPPESVVPGDVLIIAAGAFVAADARLLEADGLVVDESALTGESMPVHKSAAVLGDPRVPLADRLNMVFRGTLVTGGSAVALVVATGAATQLGQVQSLVSSVVQRETPLQYQLRHLGLQLAIAAGSVCVGVFGLGLLRGQPLLQMLETAVSLAVAAIPEGLPTVAITTLALGIRHLAERRVLVRELTAVETLGAVQVMCLDKTGTITLNRMTVAGVFAGMRDVEREAITAAPSRASSALDAADVDALLRVAVLCSEVEIETVAGVQALRGSPTESALVQLAIDAGMGVQALRESCAPLAMQYRSETRSYMASLHRPSSDLAPLEWPGSPGSDGAPAPSLWVSVKGRSPEVLGMCRYHLKQGRVLELSEAERSSIELASERMAGRALRVLGFAATRWAAERAAAAFTLEGASDLVWLGLVGMSDPPRDGMRETLQRFHAAGVRTVMITGDQSATAYAIGKSVGLSADDHLEILDSSELEGIAPEVLRALAQRIHIFSRVSPAHKLQIVQALQSAGLTVAMTGDGINDSPALKAADVGVAMGGSGSLAAREVADVVLEDDNLETMIGGIEQGRAIYDDIKKAVHFILSTNISEILLTCLGVAVGAGQTLTPMQLLWINLLSDIFPELALAVQPPEADVLRRPPRDPARPMFDRRDLARVALEGAVLTGGPLLAYAYGRGRYGLGPRANTLAFTVLAVTQLLHVVSSRSERHTIFDAERLASNKYIPMAVGGGLALQFLVTLVPGMRRILGVVPLGLLDWGVVGLAAVGPLLTNETIKLVLRPLESPGVGAAPAASVTRG